jgi:hypothetical protein
MQKRNGKRRSASLARGFAALCAALIVAVPSGMADTLTSFSHQTQVELNTRRFTAQVTLGDLDQLHVAADNGAFGRVIAGPKSLTLSGGDDTGRTFTLTIESTTQGQGRGTLTLGSFVFTDSGPLNGMTDRLLQKVSSEAEKAIPSGATMLVYANWVRATPKNTALMIGHGVQKTETTSYCESICRCCEKGSWLSAWCCLSCASCDYFKNPLSSVFRGGGSIMP